MECHVLRSCLEQLGDLRLRQPQGFVLKPALDARPAILRLVENDFGIGQGLVAHQVSLLNNRTCKKRLIVARASFGIAVLSRRMASR